MATNKSPRRRHLLAACEMPPLTEDMAPATVAGILTGIMGLDGAILWTEQIAYETGWSPKNQGVHQLLLAARQEGGPAA